MREPPLPRCLDHILQSRMARPPSQFIPNSVRTRYQLSRSPGAGSIDDRNITAGDPPHDIDDLAIEYPVEFPMLNARSSMRIEGLQSKHVCLRDIDDVNIVANAGSIRVS